MIRVMIVEDDPMVAEFNKRYLEQVGGFELVTVCSSVDQAMGVLEEQRIDILLLDIFMPGENGLALLSYIRENEKEIDVIVISAASDIERIQKALRLGAVDYLIKPFEFERFNAALSAYREKAAFIQNQHVLNQEELDQQILRKEEKRLPEGLPKGLTQDTLKMIWNVITDIKTAPFSTEDVVSRTGISRVSVRKYLRFLKDIEVLDVKVVYGMVGRPVYQHEFNNAKGNVIKHYL
ncbi:MULTISPECIES: response regulator [Metabacillus]|uniref:Response regulator n=1 Tax=Metabacillus rhizolycopersici TaxID=2875709 RepID=A0ABS7UVZ6_9BACI|nr:MULTISPECIES: response regulator [Metabacillus]MBZ5752480.1 response regulator [Metabacillus rhizolycopersici]MCM3655239.1 response regulator [Metabacillus litoralis]